MRPDLLLTILIATISLCLCTQAAEAQATPSPAARVAQAPRPARADSPARAPAPREAAQTRKSISEKLFDADWVLFPARLALVIVFIATATFLLVGGSWVTVRIAHSLKHLQWKQPPRRLKRAEVGAAGTTLALELEAEFEKNLEQDAERDRQIATLRDTVTHLSQAHERFSTALEDLLHNRPEVESDGSADQGQALC